MLFTPQDKITRASLTAAKDEPIWVRIYAQKVDLTDLWIDETDPENQRGESATGYFRHEDRERDGGGYYDSPVLMGACIEGDAVTYLTAADFSARIGQEADARMDLWLNEQALEADD